MQKVKILVVKHGALGDVIQALDGFASLRAAYPHAHIAVMTAPTCAPLFSLMPWFDEVVIDCREKLFNFLQALLRGNILNFIKVIMVNNILNQILWVNATIHAPI